MVFYLLLALLLQLFFCFSLCWLVLWLIYTVFYLLVFFVLSLSWSYGALWLQCCLLVCYFYVNISFQLLLSSWSRRLTRMLLSYIFNFSLIFSKNKYLSSKELVNWFPVLSYFFIKLQWYMKFSISFHFKTSGRKSMIQTISWKIC